MKEVFRKFDSRLKKNKNGYIDFARSKGYDYYSEYVYNTLKNRTAMSISKEMKAAGVEGYPTVNSISSLICRLKAECAEPQKEKRICVKCEKRVIPDENLRFCKHCQLINAQISETIEYHVNYAVSL